MPPCTPPLNDTKGLMDDRRVPRPIGGERSHRKAPGPPPVAAANMAAVGEYGKLWALNAELTGEWTPTTSPLMSSAPIPASVITSSVITGGNMAYDVNAVAAQDGDGPPSDAPDGNSFSDSLPVDPATEQNFQVTRFYGVCLGLRGASTCAPVSHLSEHGERYNVSAGARCSAFSINVTPLNPRLGPPLKVLGARYSSVVRAFAHGAMGHQIDPS